MKKLFFGLTLFIILVVGSIYGVLFTSAGNSFVASLIEQKVNEGQDDVNMKINDFKLTMNDILFNATIDGNSTINIEGDLNIFAKSVDLKYDLNIEDLAKLQNITKQKLNGSFSTKGTVKGDQKLAVVKGESKIASGETNYDVKLVDFKPNTVLYSMKDTKIEELLYLVNQPIYANGILNIQANIKNADINNLNGEVLTTISKGLVNAKAINKELKQNPKTPITFKSVTLTKLNSTMINTKVNFDSNLAKFDIDDANFNTKDNSLKSDYKLVVKNLALVEQLINNKFNGGFTTSGLVTMKDNNLNVKGDSNLLKSTTNYSLDLIDSKPKNINLNIKDGKIAELLYMLNQPSYANGDINIDAKIPNGDTQNLDGKVLTKISNGLVNNVVVNKAFNQKLKNKINFDGNITTDLEDTKATSIVDINTTLANLDMKKVVFDLSSGTLTSDYVANISDLSKLYDVTSKKMRGAIKIEGDIKKDTDTLSIDGKSSLFGGKVDFNLVNDDFKTKIDDVEIKKLLHMMYYPEIFTSKSNIDVKYNLATKVGKVEGNLLNGQFIKNEYSTIINTFAKFDITKELYEKTEIKSDIKDNIINSVVDMKSKNTTISVPSSTLDTKKNTINALVQSKILKYEFDTTIKGNLNKPKVKVDTGKFLKNKYKKKIEKQIKKKLGIDLDINKLFNKNEKKQQKAPATNEEIAEAFKKFFGQN